MAHKGHYWCEGTSGATDSFRPVVSPQFQLPNASCTRGSPLAVGMCMQYQDLPSYAPLCLFQSKERGTWYWNQIFIYAGKHHAKQPYSADTQDNVCLATAEMAYGLAQTRFLSFFVTEHQLYSEGNCSAERPHFTAPS